MARSFAAQKKLTKRELQVITGHMCFAAKAVHGARTFSRLFIDELAYLDLPPHRVRVTSRLRAEFRCWCDTAPLFNGLTRRKFGAVKPLVCVTTDASLAGYGAVLGHRWMAGSWDPISKPAEEFLSNWIIGPPVADSLRENINYLELIAACLPLLIWAPLLSGHYVLVESDNASTEAFLNRGTVKNTDSLKTFISCIL